MYKKEKNVSKAYKQILKPTFIMGGSSIVTTILGIVRTKFLAVILGPAGVGLSGIFMSTTNLVGTVCGCGVGESGIRQIAKASGTDDVESISRTALCVRRMAFLSGIAGALLMFFSGGYLSVLTFGSAGHSFDFSVLAVAVFFSAVSEGRMALIQGLRRISDLARLTVLGALGGTVLSIPVIYFVGEKGIAFYLLVIAAITIFASWWYSRKIVSVRAGIRWRDSFTEAKPLLRLGLAFMLGALLSVLSQYLLRVIIVRHGGLDAAGVYQASTTLSTVYVGIILRAMITDFYPRLTAAINNTDESNSLMNKQIEVGLLLAAPVILATITLAPTVISVFYSSKFALAADILKWQILGVLLQVVTWPMGFMLRAKGAGKLFFWTELFGYGMLVGLALVGLAYFGLSGIGMAFFGMNLSYGILILCIVHRNYGFSFAARNIRILCTFFFTIIFAFAASVFLKESYLIINLIITAAAGLFSINQLFYSTDIIPSFLLRIKSLFYPN